MYATNAYGEDWANVTTNFFTAKSVNIGRPDGYRVVLSTLMKNPLPIVVPCHRVVTSKPGGGSYIAGARKKAFLLKLEQKGLQLD